jgi:GH24 family phage-related lysozyme (muramidase)
VNNPPEPRVNPLAVGSAPQENLTAATGRELFDMANRFFQHAVLGRPDTNREARERNLGTPTTISRELYDAREAARNRPAPAAPAPAPAAPAAQPEPETTPNVVQQATQYISGNEGFRSAAYPDPIHGAERPTIGFGTTRNRMVDAYLQGQGLNPDQVFNIGGGVNITRRQAEDMRDLYIQHSLNQMTNRQDTPWFQNLPPEAQVIMLDMSFNLGANFRFPRMFDALQRGDFNTAADEILNSQYAGQVANRARRNAEAMRALAGQGQ